MSSVGCTNSLCLGSAVQEHHSDEFTPQMEAKLNKKAF